MLKVVVTNVGFSVVNYPTTSWFAVPSNNNNDLIHQPHITVKGLKSKTTK